MSEAALKSQSLVLFHVKYSCGISGAAALWRIEFPSEYCSHLCLNPRETIESLSFDDSQKELSSITEGFTGPNIITSNRLMGGDNNINLKSWMLLYGQYQLL